MSIIEKAMDAGADTRVHTLDSAKTKSNSALDNYFGIAVENDRFSPRAGIGRMSGCTDAPSADRTTTVYREINIEALRQAGMITPDDDVSGIAEEYRRIKRHLLVNASGYGHQSFEYGNLIMVTSALAREGKSFSAVNLAISMTMEIDRTILLIDADFANPSIPTYLGMDLKDERGLMDVIADPSIGLHEVLIKTNIKNLNVLPAGQPRPRATELLSSDAMLHLVQEISHRYSDRIVIFDSPPVLLTSAASVMASLMGQVVIVVEEQVTKHDVLEKTLLLLEAAPVVGVVLNKTAYSTNAMYGDYFGGASQKLRSSLAALSADSLKNTP
jgi:receptor protein-tyrosine kinase